MIRYVSDSAVLQVPAILCLHLFLELISPRRPDPDHLPMPGFENPLHGRPPNPFGPPSGPGMGGRGPGLGGRGPGFGGHGPGFGDFY